MLFARDDPRSNQHYPPWVTVFESPTPSSSSPSATASASSVDDNGDDSNGSTTSGTELQSTSRSLSVAGPSTLATSISLESNAVELSATLASPTRTGSSLTSKSSLQDQTTSTLSWSSTSDGPSTTSSIVRTQPAPESLSGDSYPSLSITSSPKSTSTDLASLPDQHISNHSDRHSFNGALLAGVVVPIVVLLVIGVGVLLCLRRRRRGQDVMFAPVSGVAEKLFAKRTSSEPSSAAMGQTPLPPPHQPHLIMSTQNNTYFTGLDTMSMISSEPRDRLSEEPPPPYWPRGDSATRSISMRSNNGRSITAPAPVFLDVPSPVSPMERRAIPEHSPFDDPPSNARTPSFRSITSTLYSSNASVVEARPARRSIVSAHIVGEDESSPFADPESDEDERR